MIGRTVLMPLSNTYWMLQALAVKGWNFQEAFETFKKLGYRNGLFRGTLLEYIRLFTLVWCRMSLEGIQESAEEYESLNAVKNGVAGAVIGCVLSFPLDVLRSRYVIDVRPTTTVRSTFEDIWQRQGVRGFYRGLDSAVFAAGLYEAVGRICHILNSKWSSKPVDQKPIHRQLFDNFLVTAVAHIVRHPLTTVKRIYQTGDLVSGKQYSETMEVVRDIYQARGIAGFYDGLGVALLACVGELCLEFVVYSAGVALLDDTEDDDAAN